MGGTSHGTSQMKTIIYPKSTMQRVVGTARTLNVAGPSVKTAQMVSPLFYGVWEEKSV
jgi:hypothetical protein